MTGTGRGGPLGVFLVVFVSDSGAWLSGLFVPLPEVQNMSFTGIFSFQIKPLLVRQSLLLTERKALEWIARV